MTQQLVQNISRSPSIRDRVRTIDWQAVNWERRNGALAIELGVPERAVGLARDILRKPDPPLGAHDKGIVLKEQWRGRISGVTLAEFCRATHTTIQVARRIAKSLGERFHPNMPELNQGARRQRCRYDWNVVDWSMNNAQIAAIAIVSEERVRQVRSLRGEQESLNKNIHVESLKVERYAASISDSDMRRMTRDELSIALGCSYDRAGWVAQRRGVRLKNPCTIYGDSIVEWNWDLPTRDLSLVWIGRYDYSTSVKVSQNRPKDRKPKWDIRYGHTPTDPEYNVALEAEKQKCDQWRAASRNGQVADSTSDVAEMQESSHAQ